MFNYFLRVPGFTLGYLQGFVLLIPLVFCCWIVSFSSCIYSFCVLCDQSCLCLRIVNSFAPSVFSNVYLQNEDKLETMGYPLYFTFGITPQYNWINALCVGWWTSHYISAKQFWINTYYSFMFCFISGKYMLFLWQDEQDLNY